MTKILNYLSFVFLLALMVSCDPIPDVNGDLLNGVKNIPITTNPGTNATQKRINKVVEVDDEGEILTIDYVYSSNKLSKVIAKSTDGESNEYSLVYNNDIITKVDIKRVLQVGDVPINIAMNLSYANGKLTKAEGKGVSEGTDLFTNTSQFSYNNGKLSKVETSYVMPTGDLFSSLESLIGYQGDNINSWKLTSTTTGLPPIITSLSFLSYDNYKNPFASLPEAFNTLSTNYGMGTSAFGGLSKNNFVDANAITMGMTFNFKYVYTYDKDGYPTKGVKSDGSSITFTY
ncbi:hypothetical protein [Chryseobacterium sp. T1]